MPHFKSGDLVVLKSGGPAMTVETVNTDISDDKKITGIVCVWFVGEKLERVRFEQGLLSMRSQKVPKGRNQQRLPPLDETSIDCQSSCFCIRFGERDQLVPMFRATVGTDGRLATRSLLRCNNFVAF